VLQKTLLAFMTPIAEAFKKERQDKKDFWENELKSLGVEPWRQNDLNDKEVLQLLVEIIKQIYFQDYKTAYDANNSNIST
jgi:hypothetical protein